MRVMISSPICLGRTLTAPTSLWPALLFLAYGPTPLCSTKVPVVPLPEDLDDVPADFLPQPPGPFRLLRNSAGPVRCLPWLVERHCLKPDAEGAAQSFEGVEAGEAPRRMAWTVPLLPVALRDISRSDIPDRSMRSRRRCLKLMDESKAFLRCEGHPKTRMGRCGVISAGIACRIIKLV